MKVKVRVLKMYFDKDTGKLKEADKVYEYEEARANELIEKGFCKLEEEPKPEIVEEEPEVIEEPKQKAKTKKKKK